MQLSSASSAFTSDSTITSQDTTTSLALPIHLKMMHQDYAELLTHIQSVAPQNHGYQLWTPSQKIISSAISALRNKPSKPESVLVEPTLPIPHGTFGNPSPIAWASNPFLKSSKIKYESYKSSHSKFDLDNLHPMAIQSGLDWLKITYGSRLHTVCCPDVP